VERDDDQETNDLDKCVADLLLQPLLTSGGSSSQVSGCVLRCALLCCDAM
jgi:hypothetical protein